MRYRVRKDVRDRPYTKRNPCTTPPPSHAESDQQFTEHARRLAQTTAEAGEEPVGTLIAREGRVLGEGVNQPISGDDSTAHGEVITLRAAAQTTGNYRLPGHGARAPKTGACGSSADQFGEPRLNHHATVEGCAMVEDALELLRPPH